MVPSLTAEHGLWSTGSVAVAGVEEDMAAHSSRLAWRIPMDRGAWRATVHRVAKSQPATCSFPSAEGLGWMATSASWDLVD